MKTDYKNWMPDNLLKDFKHLSYGSLFVSKLLFIYIFIRKFRKKKYLKWLSILTVVLFPLSLVMIYYYSRFKKMSENFDFNKEDSLSWKIIKNTANSLDLKTGDKVLDVGCGSGALSIEIAKKNPNCEVLGVDKWGYSYKDFNKELCENNAKVEGVENVSFQSDDAKKLSFENESFDAVCSNYVYHNITGNKQKYLLETLRVLKKGGKFAIHDIFNKTSYGNMDEFKDTLLDMGYEQVDLIDTTNGYPITKIEARELMLTGSKLLIGIK